MKLTKVQIVSALISIGATLDTLVAFVTNNQSLLSEIGITTKWILLIQLVGLIYTALSPSLLKNKKKDDDDTKVYADGPELPPDDNGEIVGTRPPTSGGR